jgi:hypothetical protein
MTDRNYSVSVHTASSTGCQLAVSLRNGADTTFRDTINIAPGFSSIYQTSTKALKRYVGGTNGSILRFILDFFYNSDESSSRDSSSNELLFFNLGIIKTF